MPDIEERLRTGLATLAADVPRSVHPRDELDRRLDSRRRRPGPALATAAAVVALAGVFVPIALSGDDPTPTSPASTDTTGTTATTSSAASSGGLSPETAALVMSVAAGGMGPDAWTLDLVEEVDGDRFCFVVRTGHQWDDEPLCFAPPTFTSGNGMVEARSVVDMTAGMDMPPVLRDDLPHHLLFFARPEVAAMNVRSGDRQEWAALASHVEPGTSQSIFLATFVGTYEDFRYTAKDRDGKVVEQATS